MNLWNTLTAPYPQHFLDSQIPASLNTLDDNDWWMGKRVRIHSMPAYTYYEIFGGFGWYAGLQNVGNQATPIYHLIFSLWGGDAASCKSPPGCPAGGIINPHGGCGDHQRDTAEGYFYQITLPLEFAEEAQYEMAVHQYVTRESHQNYVVVEVFYRKEGGDWTYVGSASTVGKDQGSYLGDATMLGSFVEQFACDGSQDAGRCGYADRAITFGPGWMYHKESSTLLQSTLLEIPAFDVHFYTGRNLDYAHQIHTTSTGSGLKWSTGSFGYGQDIYAADWFERSAGSSPDKSLHLVHTFAKQWNRTSDFVKTIDFAKLLQLGCYSPLETTVVV